MTTRMNIIQITPEFPENCGGLGYYVYYLCRELARLGHNVSVISRNTQGHIHSYEGVSVAGIRVPGPAPFNLPFFKRKAEELVASQKPDLIHVHSSAMPTINCECPKVATAHWCNAKGIPAFHRPVKNVDSLYRNLMLPVYRVIESKFANFCDKLTVVSDSLQREFQEFYGVHADVIHNGVDHSIFKADDVVEKDKTILFTGKLDFGKGVLDLLAVAELLQKSHPDMTMQILGNGHLKGHLNRNIKTRGLNNVQVVCHISHPEIIKYYQSALVYVFPTYYEGLPTTVLEAMACELPVVATNVSGIPDQIDDGITGYMLPPGDIVGFHKRISELLDDEAKRRQFGKVARKKVTERFSWPRIAKGVHAKYKELLEK